MIFDELSLLSASIFIALALVTWGCLPKRDCGQGQLFSLGCIVAGTLLAYCSASLPLFAAGWALTVLPYWVWMKTGPKVALSLGTIAVVAGAGLASLDGPTARVWAFVVLALAVALRKGIFPFHSWVVSGLDQSPMLPLGLLLNGHLGAFLMLRFAIPLFPEVASPALTVLSVAALFTALYAAVLALSEKRPRRLLGYVTVSQASFLLAGLQDRNLAGVTGALVYWFVVAAATTGLYCVFRAIEARYPAVSSPAEFLGLVNSTPRMAVFFAICGLGLAGLPGTLGFAAEDLLFHGALDSNPWLGITLPLATAFNAITLYRLFAMLFLGRAAAATPKLRDAMPGERWALSAVAVFLVANGIVPSFLVSMRTPAAERIASILSGQ